MTTGNSSTDRSTVWEPTAFAWVLTLSALEVLILYILFALETPLTPIIYGLTRRPVWLVLFVTMLTICLGFLLACVYQLVIKLQRTLCLLFLIAFLGCNDDDQVICAPLPPWAVAVDVRDSVTGVLLASGTRGAVFLGGILDDSLRPERLFHLSSDTLLVGGMTEGRVEVRVEREGYFPWVAGDVQTRLSEGDCPDWETQELVARLQAAPE